METMTLERQSEQTTAESLAPVTYTEQLELELGLTLEQRRRLNANAIMHALDMHEHVTIAASSPGVCGPDAARMAARARRRSISSGF